MWQALEKRGKCTSFLCESPKESGHSDDQGVDGRLRVDWILGRLAAGIWSGLRWLTIETRGGLL
jgi:hypothetical protein